MDQLRRLPKEGRTSATSQAHSLDRRKAFSGNNPQTLTASPSTRSSMAMAIPNIRQQEVPPPLPPPRWNGELAQGNDLSWEWGNSERPAGFHRLAPIHSASSLYGGFSDPRRTSTGAASRQSDEMELDIHDSDGWDNAVSTSRSPALLHLHLEDHARGWARRPSSPGSRANQRLQGENPLAQANLNRSSHAYDKHLLSKIGKSRSPPQHTPIMEFTDGDGGVLARKLSIQTNHAPVTRQPNLDDDAFATDSPSAWGAIPFSTLSPESRHNWREYRTSYRSPSVDSQAPSIVLDPDTSIHSGRGEPRSASASLSGFKDAVAPTARSHNQNNDDFFVSGSEHDIGVDDPLVLQQASVTDRYQSTMKRRALSPPDHMSRDDKYAASQSDVFQKSPGGAPSRSPLLRHYPKDNSVSSTTSSGRHGSYASYASSAALSAGASSMTSASSLEQSPGVITPSDIATGSPFSTIPPHGPSMVLMQRSGRTFQDTKLGLRMPKQPIAASAIGARQHVGSRVGGHFICDCCPKKPKKFETEDALRIHEMEKQYSCQFCHNRFKNKNEAERHQNSLHLRRHSWSCAAMLGYEAAFHSSIPSNAQVASSASHDTCGYCGEEFSNIPQPDWDLRVEHLIAVHKFGECNHAKKFYRADHFRQHLKHSHAGQSGRWTNMLENACMKEEVPTGTDSYNNSPTGSDTSQGPSNLTLLGGPPMGGATIRESQDET